MLCADHVFSSYVKELVKQHESKKREHSANNYRLFDLSNIQEKSLPYRKAFFCVNNLVTSRLQTHMIMKKLKLALLLFVATSLQAQVPELYGPIFDHQNIMFDALAKGATWMKISEKEKEDEPSSSSIVVLGENQIESVTRFASNGNKINTTTNEYNAEGQLIKSTTVSPAEKELKRSEIAYNHLGSPINRVDYVKGKVVEKQNTWYNAEGQINEHVQYQEGGNLIQYRWKYDYKENDDLWHTYLCNAKNDTITVWTYACNKAGKLVRAKNETEICQWEEKDRKGNTLRFEKRISKSEVSTKKEVFNHDNLKIASIVYNAYERIIERYSYEYVNGLLVEWINHEPGDNDGIIARQTRDYTDAGDLYNVVSYDNKNEPVKYVRYEYQF